MSRTRFGWRDDVLAGDERAPGVRLRQRREHADGRRLAGAVRAEQAEDLALAHGERDAVERLHVLVALAQVSTTIASTPPMLADGC